MESTQTRDGRRELRALFERMAEHLVADGHLFLGHSETLFKVSERFRLIGKMVYQRTC